MPTFGAWQLSDLAITGPDPFASNATAESDAVGATSFTISPSAAVQQVQLNDNDASFEDADSGQQLASGAVFDGVSWAAGDSVETEYSYIIRPSGSTDPADNITIYVLEYEGQVHGIASSERLFAGQSYDIVAIDSNDPVVAYSSMAICFAAGSLIATKQGPMPVDRLREGMRVQTMDNGYQPLRWSGRWLVNGRGANAPVRFATGVLGNSRPLLLSGQHRVLVRPERGPLKGEEIPVAARALVGQPGISRAPCDRIHWVHLLFESHEVLFAEDARAESLLPGPSALGAVGPDTARFLREIRDADPMSTLPARPIVPTGKAARILRLKQTV
ncbi:Hint domain-containing protein [Thioclava sp. 'Guangxiensis']|uniref:Hint domain-containing protein n=1 Tax=Thioclava sp. 'Guangxiensis' TaxID=3149044 RepID=UPI003877BD4E